MRVRIRSAIADLPSDVARHVAFHPKDVAEIAIIALGPQMLVGGSLDELRPDSHPVANPFDRTFDNGIHVKFAADLRHSLV